MKEQNPKELKNELLQVFLELEAFYLESHTTTVPEKRIAYLELELAEHLLNAIKSLEYHCRDDIPEMRTKKNWSAQLKRANNIIKKYGENIESGNLNSSLQLKEILDSTGYLTHRNYIKDAKKKFL